jgi:hypothetical protein
VPLRFPRPVIPVIAIGMAAVWVVAGSAPAFADQVRQQEFWLSQLNVTSSWQASEGSGVTIAVLSDGVDAQQPDLGGIVTTGPDFTGTGQESGPFFGAAGTAAASLIAGRGTGPGGTSGIIGIAPKAHILSVRVTLDPADTALDATATGAALPGAIASGIRYAVAHGASVIDLPLDPGRPNPSAIAALPIPRFSTEPPQLNGILAAEGGSQAEQQAVAYAISKGVVLVAPAGDNALGTDAANFPAAYPHVISVGAFGSNFARGAFSSNQSYVTVTASGVNVTAASALGGYTTVNSTAAASALVSGIAALIKAQFPHLSPDQVQQALSSSTVVRPPGGQAPGSGTGSVDAGRALLAAASLAAPASARASASAQPVSRPPAPAAAPVASSLTPKLLRAAAISLGALIVLLVAIFWYSRTGRKQEQDSAQATADWSRSTQNAFSPYGPGDNRTEADKMLEYFAAPSSNPTAVSSPFGGSTGVLTTNRGSSRNSTSSRASTSRSSSEAAASAASGVGGAWSSGAPAPKVQGRRAEVSGTPPWEPASQPASELPWAAIPGTVTGGRTAAASAGGAGSDSVWPSTPATPAAASAASSQSWDELAASTAAGAPARPAGELAPPPSAESVLASDPVLGGSTTEQPAASGTGLARRGGNAPAAPDAGDAYGAGPYDAAGASGEPGGAGTSLWGGVSLPHRSPSGSNWDADAGAGSENGPAGPDDASWPDAQGDDAYRSAPDSEDGWQPAAQWQPGAAAQWQPRADAAPGPPDDGAAGLGAPGESPAQWPSDENATPSWLPAAPALDSAPRWGTGPESAPWQAADAAPRWEPADTGAQWPTADAGTGWSPASTDSWSVPDSGSQWQASTAAATPAPWEPAAPTSGWAPAAESSWETRSHGDEDGEPFNWRPARPAEGLPPAGGDASS